MADLLKENDINVPVSSANLINRNKEKIKNIDVFLIDEAHHSSADSYQEVFKVFPNAQRVGFSATPMRNDDKDLIGVYQNLIQSDVTTKDLIDRGYLSKFVYYAPKQLRCCQPFYFKRQVKRRRWGILSTVVLRL